MVGNGTRTDLSLLTRTNQIWPGRNDPSAAWIPIAHAGPIRSGSWTHEKISVAFAARSSRARLTFTSEAFSPGKSCSHHPSGKQVATVARDGPLAMARIA